MKKDLTSFSFERYKSGVELSEETLAPFRYNASWLLPQMMAFLGSEQFKLIRNTDTNKISMKETLARWVRDCKEGKITYNGFPVSFDFFQGFFRILNHAPRGEILGSKMTQSKPEGARWAASVPLVLSAFKEYRNIKYGEWDLDRESLKYFVDRSLEPLLNLYPFEHPFSNDELIFIRNETDNGKPITSRINITRSSNEEFNKLPRYVKTLLCQVWIYHPSIRHPLAITDLLDLDNPAKPLVTSDIFEEVTLTKRNDEDAPWDV